MCGEPRRRGTFEARRAVVARWFAQFRAKGPVGAALAPCEAYFLRRGAFYICLGGAALRNACGVTHQSSRGLGLDSQDVGRLRGALADSLQRKLSCVDFERAVHKSRRGVDSKDVGCLRGAFFKPPGRCGLGIVRNIGG